MSINTNMNLRDISSDQEIITFLEAYYPVRNCGCMIHVRRPGHREICCGSKIDIQDIKDIVVRKYGSMRLGNFKILIIPDINGGYEIFGSLPDIFCSKIQLLKRPIHYFVLLENETYDIAMKIYKTRSIMHRRNRFELRLMAHLRSCENLIRERDHIDTDDDVIMDTSSS